MAKVIICLIQFLVLTTIQFVTDDPVLGVQNDNKNIKMHSKHRIECKRTVVKKHLKWNVKTVGKGV
jgi:hypothetical protein